MINDNKDSINLDTNKSDDIIIFNTVKQGNLKLTKLLISNSNIDINAKDEYGHTILHIAVIFKHIKIVIFLLEQNKIDINVKDGYGLTPLHYAVKMGNYIFVDILTKNPSIKIDVKDMFNRSPIDYAIFNKDDELTNLLKNMI